MASQLSMWKDDDPEGYAEDGGGMKRPGRKRKKGKGAQKRSSSARPARSRKAAKKSTRSSSAGKKERKAPPVEREYKTKSGHRYVLRRLAD